MTVLGQALVALGVLLIGVAGIGLLRLPDVFARINAGAKAAGLGVVCVLLGVAVLMPGPATVAVLALAIVLQLATVPLAGYALGEAAWSSAAPLLPRTRRDRLGDGEAPSPAGTD